MDIAFQEGERSSCRRQSSVNFPCIYSGRSFDDNRKVVIPVRKQYGRRRVGFSGGGLSLRFVSAKSRATGMQAMQPEYNCPVSAPNFQFGVSSIQYPVFMLYSASSGSRFTSDQSCSSRSKRDTVKTWTKTMGSSAKGLGVCEQSGMQGVATL
jgi:hypothetical protein